VYISPAAGNPFHLEEDMKLRFAFVPIALLALSASVALAQDPQGPPGGMGGMGGGMRQGGPARRMQALLNGITLTSQQQTTIDSIQGAYQPRMRALFTPGSPPDSTARARMVALRADEDKDIRAVLTPDQQKIFDKNLADLPPMGAGRRPGGQ
jgi:Spy/CpxP family protein refolding chaperone